jgi:hypothetical protein
MLLATYKWIRVKSLYRNHKFRRGLIVISDIAYRDPCKVTGGLKLLNYLNIACRSDGHAEL